jgi:hypothetical protein
LLKWPREKFFVHIMSESVEIKNKAWQPLTPRGIAAFAQASWLRLLLVQFIVAVLTAATVVWFLRTAWFPTVREAISQLPVSGEIQAGTLNWRSSSPQLLAEGHFLTFTVDTNHTGVLKSPAHFQIELGSQTVRVFSLFGFWDFPYSKNYLVAFNRTDLEPWWGAWQPPILWMTVAGVIIGLLLSWTLLAIIYALPVWLAAYFANRNLSMGSSGKLAGAALMPGALMLMIAIFFYGIGAVDVIQLLIAFSVHWILGWVFMIWAALSSPKIILPESAGKNPFTNKADKDDVDTMNSP